MKNLALITAIIVMLFSLSACGGSTVKLDETTNGQTVALKVGQKLTISLEGNPTTGYSWDVSEIDQAVIEQVGEAEFKSDSNLIGSGGLVTLTFNGVAPGETRIKLVYHKAWEEDVPPLEEFEIFVKVN